MTFPCCDELSCPCPHVKLGAWACGPPPHRWVKLSQLPGDIGLQLVERGRARAVDLGLQVAPEAEVEGGEAGGSRRLPALQTPPVDHYVSKLVNDKDITALD